MSLFKDIVRGITGPLTQREPTLSQVLNSRTLDSRADNPLPSPDQMFRNSVWWACLMTRANIMSTFPLDIFRPAAGGLGVPVKAPKFFTEPAPGLDRTEYLFGTSVDLDRYGNSIDIITGRNTYGKITEIEPVNMGPHVRAVVKDNRIIKWRINNDEYGASDIWHQKQYTIKGLPLGIPTMAYSAYTMGLYNSAQQFALDWFGLGAMPRGMLQNTVRETVPADVREAAKELFKASTLGGDIFVTGNEWEWTPASTDSMSPNFLAQQAESSRDVCRFLGVPASMIDVEVSTGNVTYANITQANLQWLITQIGPAVTRMERSWTTYTTPGPWYVKFNTSALLRMDDQTRNTVLLSQLAAKARTPTEVRALDNLPPYTPDQIAELEMFSSMGKPAPTAPAERKEIA